MMIEAERAGARWVRLAYRAAAAYGLLLVLPLYATEWMLRRTGATLLPHPQRTDLAVASRASPRRCSAEETPRHADAVYAELILNYVLLFALLSAAVWRKERLVGQKASHRFAGRIDQSGWTRPNFRLRTQRKPVGETDEPRVHQTA